nr:hypothetical protein 6 [Desulfobulbaceae bacterium]
MKKKARVETSSKGLLDEIFEFANEKDRTVLPIRLVKIRRLAFMLRFGFYEDFTDLNEPARAMIRLEHESDKIHQITTSEGIQGELDKFLRGLSSGEVVTLESPIKQMLFQQKKEATEPAVRINFGGSSWNDLCAMTLMLMFFRGVKGVRKCPVPGCQNFMLIYRKDKQTCSPRCRTRLKRSKLTKEQKDKINKERVAKYKADTLYGGKK